MNRARSAFNGLFLALTMSVPGAATGPATGSARLGAPAGVESTLNAAVSLPVRAIPATVGAPVPKGSILVEMNVEKIERELRELQRTLREVQEEKRYRKSNKEVQRGGGTQAFQGPENSIETNLAIKEADAMRDLLEVQTKLSIASPRAPEDGYLLRSFYAVGADAKRRKPLVSFVAASKTVLEVSLAGATPDDFPVGSAVTVRSAEAAQQAFRGVVLTSLAGAEGLELAVRPVELPFLALDRPAAVTIEKTP